MNSINHEVVLDYFEEISKIPRETGKEKQISDFIVNFAKERNLEVIQDEVFNVIIKKESTIEDYSGPTVILQGHMDMVYEKEPDSDHVYENGIEIIEKDGFLYGNKTTLGADNGIAIAYFLALIDNNEIKHPDLEIIVTAQEEAGLVGAQKLDMSNIKGSYLINLDAEEEGTFITSCAGGARNYLHIPCPRKLVKGYKPLTIYIHGLKGGHSGLDIDKGRGNAIKLLGRLLHHINGDYLHLLSIDVPGKANAIPAKAKATILVRESKKEEVILKIKDMENMLKDESIITDENIVIDLVEEKPFSEIYNVYTKECKNKIIDILMLLPFGVLNKSFAIPGLVQTSMNTGAIEESEDRISILSSIRSSVRSEKFHIMNVIQTMGNVFNINCEFFNEYPEWEYKPDSMLRKIVEEVYEVNFNKKPKMMAMHAGLECGYFSNRLGNIDIISFGPDLHQVHTTNEHVSIQSINNTWLFLVKLLERISKCK